MEIATRVVGNVTLVDVKGDIDLYHTPEMRRVLMAELREKRTPRVVVNLTQVRYIDSSGVASLVVGLKAARDMNARFGLFGLSKSAREVLELSRLIKVFEVFENEEQALAAK